MNKYAKLTPEGTGDLLFEECEARRSVERSLSVLFKQRGYKKVITPTIEFFDVFNRPSAGFSPEDLYSMTDSFGRLLVLRADSTMPIARIAATRLRNESIPIRLYYNQNVFRRQQRFSGLNDESTQSGIELIGVKGFRADVEVLTTAADALSACGVSDYRIEIGHADFFKALASELNASSETISLLCEYIEAKNYGEVNDLLENFGENNAAKAIRQLPHLFGGVEVISKARELCSSAGAVSALDYLEKLLEEVKNIVPEDKINIDLGLVHRSNYYTGVVFRGYIQGSGLTVLSGGRYDGLVAEFGKSLPSIGFGVDVDALAYALLSSGSVPKTKSVDVLVYAENGCETKAMLKIRELNAQGLSCENCVFETEHEASEYAKQKGIKKIEIIK